MDTDTLKSLAELGYAFILIAYLVSDNRSLRNRLRQVQDDYVDHLKGDAKDDKKED